MCSIRCARSWFKFDVGNLRARFLVLVICNDKGDRIFDASHVISLGEKSSAALSRVHEAAMSLNGMTDDDFEELAGNLKNTRDGDSTSSSPKNSGAQSGVSSQKSTCVN